MEREIMGGRETENEKAEIDRQILGLFEKRLRLTDGAVMQGAAAPDENSQYDAALLDFINELGLNRARQLDAVRDGTGAKFLEALSPAGGKDENVKTRVAAQGVPGSYAGIAAKKLCPGGEIVFYETWEEVFTAVGRGEADSGVLPIENSTAGSVLEIYDLLLKYRFYISGAIKLAINHCLLGVPGATENSVTDVYSHPQAFSQCRGFIKEHGYSRHVCLNTAAAAKMVAGSGDVTKAAIASSDCAEIYGLDVIRAPIQQESGNRTRFISVTRRPETRPGADRISLVFALPHQTGSLYRILARFAQGGHNLTKIESRPVPDRPFEYYFYVDFCGNVGAEKTAAMLGELQKELPVFHFLGNYGETEE
jgi:chorismate mutase / prephenate dehydratase